MSTLEPAVYDPSRRPFAQVHKVAGTRAPTQRGGASVSSTEALLRQVWRRQSKGGAERLRTYVKRLRR